MDYEQPGLNLPSTISAWPVKSNLAVHLPAGDLLNLSRTSSSLRAALHGFPTPQATNSDSKADKSPVRDSIFVGLHQTPEWRGLKDLSPFECSSRTHTKGSDPKPCRFCSKPICSGCIVRDSFAHRNENTFRNRTRSFCPSCWENGNLSKSMRHPLSREQMEPDTNYCTCTLKNNGWICIPCKEKQNQEAQSTESKVCHGEGCDNSVGEDADSRRMCLWCQRTLPRHRGAASRRAWNQKMIEARYRNAMSRMADLEEYNRKRSRSLRMSRRQMRGDEAVQDDPMADVLQFVRDLDVVNYRSFMPDVDAPTSEDVYQSQRGHWKYSRNFLLQARKGSDAVRWSLQFFDFQNENKPDPFQRTNKDKEEEYKLQKQAWRDIKPYIRDLTLHRTATDDNGGDTDGLQFYKYALGVGWQLDREKLKQFHELKYHILTHIVTYQLGLETTRRLMETQHDFTADRNEWLLMLCAWNRIRPHSLPKADLIRCFDEGYQETRAQIQAQRHILKLLKKQETLVGEVPPDLSDDNESTQEARDRSLALEYARREEEMWQDNFPDVQHGISPLSANGDSPPSVAISTNTNDDHLKSKAKVSDNDEQTQQTSGRNPTSEPVRPDPPSYEDVWTGAVQDTMLELPTAEGEQIDPPLVLQEDEEMYEDFGGSEERNGSSRSLSLSSSSAVTDAELNETRSWAAERVRSLD